MTPKPRIVPVKDLRQDPAGVLKRLQSSVQPLVITQRGRSAAVMLSVAAYERAERERELLRLLLRGEQQMVAGAGHDLEGVLAEAVTVLAADRP